MTKGMPFHFGFADSLRGELASVGIDALHRDIDAICRSYECLEPLAQRLGVDMEPPRLAGFAYNHVSTLGAEIVFAKDSEPNVIPMIHSPRDIDNLREPDDYLSAGVVPGRLKAMEELIARRPDAARFVGHSFEGPITTAVLLMGQDFFLLPYDDPDRAHKFLEFCVTSQCNYARVISERLGDPLKPGTVAIPDDFAGMFSPELFAEFVVPYWEAMYENLDATGRFLHSELLRSEHLPFLKQLGISTFDPSADQYLTPKLLSEQCPVPFTSRFLFWDIRDNSAERLQQMYREYAACSPESIQFTMSRADQEEKIAALLEVARELA